MTYSVKIPMIRKLAKIWLNNYHWTIRDLINNIMNSEEFTSEEKTWILGQNVIKPYNKLVRFEKSILREILTILPYSGIEYSHVREEE